MPSIVYHLLRPFVQLALRAYFRRIHIAHRERVPRGHAFILASNHPGAFTDAILQATLLSRPLHFLTRADVFKHPVASFFLRQTKQIPIYRFRDGFKNLQHNQSSFAASSQALAEGKGLMIFSEANCQPEKHLRPIQRGTARLAFHALQHLPEGRRLFIVPTGVTYTEQGRARQMVLIDYGRPLDVARYRELFAQNERQAYLQLTADLEAALRPLVVHLDKREEMPLGNALLRLLREDEDRDNRPMLEENNSLLQAQQAIADAFNAADPAKLEALRAAHDGIEALKNAHGLRSSSPPLRLWPYWGTLLLWPLSALGWLLNVPPIALAKRIALRTTQRGPEFTDGVFVGSALFLWLFWWAALFGLYGWLWPEAGRWRLLYVPLLGYLHLLQREQWAWQQEARRHARLPADATKALAEARQSIRMMLGLA